ncbi:hypothetical protein [Haloferula sp. BvORR071]|uniref:hypothetical protein n=1 Tax=Haloferula sp. BvORR071 TaxID=1396141 RepID=UPI000555D079|nr:hypothetical protein [Haloferula sp. BvORR071]
MIPRLLLASLILVTTAAADFEKWTNKDGKEAELELITAEEKDGAKTGEFVTRAGKTVSLKELDLAPESAAKLKARTVAKIRYDYGSGSRPGENDPFAADGQEAPTGATFGFLAVGENLAGIRTAGETVASFKVDGGAEWKSAKRKLEADPAPATPKSAGGLREVKFRLFIEGDHSADELKSSQLKGTVQAVFGSGLKTADAKLQLKGTKGGDIKSGKSAIGPFEVQVDQMNPFGDKEQLSVRIRDPKLGAAKEEVVASPFGDRRSVAPIPLQVAKIDVIASGKKIENVNPAFLVEGSAAGGEVTVVIQYWSKLHEKTMSFEKSPGQFEQVQ